MVGLTKVILTQYDRLDTQSTRTNTPAAVSDAATADTADNTRHITVDGLEVPSNATTSSILRPIYPDIPRNFHFLCTTGDAANASQHMSADLATAIPQTYPDYTWNEIIFFPTFAPLAPAAFNQSIPILYLKTQ